MPRLSLLLAVAALLPAPAAAQLVDQYGDPLPPGAVARLGTTRFRHGGHTLCGLAFLPDNKTLVSVSEEQSLILWEAETGKKLREINVGELQVRSFAPSRDGKQIAVGGFWWPADGKPINGAIYVLDTDSGKVVRNIAREARDMDHMALALTPDGQRLVSIGGAGLLRVQDVATGVEIAQHQFPQHDYPSMALSPDGSTVAVASGPNTRKLFLWKWQAGGEPRELKGLLERPQNPVFSPDSKRLAVVSDSSEPSLVLDVETGRPVYQLAVASDEHFYSAPAFSSDGRRLAIVGHDSWLGGSIHLYDAATGRHQQRIESAGGRLAFSADGRLLAAGGGSTLRVWDLGSMKELSASEAAHQSSIYSLAVTANGQVASASEDGTVRLWDRATGKQQQKLTHGRWVRGLAVAPDAALAASSSLDDTVKLWDLATGKELFRLAGHGESGGQRALQFTPDGQRLLSFGDDFYLRTWQVRNGKALAELRIRPTGVNIPDDDADRRGREMFFRTGRAVFTSDGARMVLDVVIGFHVFDTATGKETGIIKNEAGMVMSMTVSPDGRHLLVGMHGRGAEVRHADGSQGYQAAQEHPVQIWDLSTHRRLVRVLVPGRGVGAVAYSPDGRTFAVGSTAAPFRIALYEVASGQVRLVLDGAPCRVSALAFTPDGRKLISGFQDSTALVWEVAGRR